MTMISTEIDRILLYFHNFFIFWCGVTHRFMPFNQCCLNLGMPILSGDSDWYNTGLVPFR